MNWLLTNEPLVRSLFFFGSILLFAGLEVLIPRRKPTVNKKFRWINNFSLTFINTAMIRIFIPVLAVGTAITASGNNWGLFNHVTLDPLVSFVATVVLFDFFIYWQHRIFHKVGFLWRFHRVHHIDPNLDISSSARFHTIEIFMSLFIKMSLVVALGANPAGIIAFEILLSTCSNFNHSNINIPKWMDSILVKFIVTPDMHRVHHSVIVNQTDSNFSFCLSMWDRLFGSLHLVEYEKNHEIKIGIAEFQEEEHSKLDKMLLHPFEHK